MAPTPRPLALALALCFAPYALADEAGDTALPEVKIRAQREAPPTYNVPTARTATKMEAALRDIPQTVNVVSQSVLRDQAAHSMQDVMKTVPGVGLSTGDGQRDQVSIRGFSAIADQFIDGLRDDAMYFRDLSNVEQVEVLKGPSAVLYGRGSSGGLINRVTKKPGGEQREIGVQLGSWAQRRGEFDLAHRFADSSVAARITGAVEQAGSYRDPQFLSRQAVAPSLAFKLDAATDVQLQAEYLSDRRVTDFGIPSYQGRPVDVDPRTYYGAANARDADFTQSRVTALAGTVTRRLGGGWTLRNATRYYDFTLNRNNTTIASVNEKTLTATLNHGSILRQEHGVFNQTELTQDTTLFGLPQQLLYGMEFGTQYKDAVVRQRTGFATVSLFNPVLPVVSTAIPGTLTTDSLGVLGVSSAYVQDLATLSAQWKALAGMRYDVFTQQTYERRIGQPDLNRTDRAVSPRLGVVYQPTLAQAYYASVSRSFQPSGENSAITTSNAAFAPERTTGQEIGAKLDFFGGLASLSAALFHLERTNIKATDPVTNLVIPLGVQRTNGLELSFAGELPRNWQLSAGYAWLNARMVQSVAVDSGQPVAGKRPTLTPTHSGNVWASKALGGGFGLGAGVNYVGDRFANPGNTVTLPAYTTVDTMAYYRRAAYDVQINLSNLFDRRYIVAGHGSNANLNLPGAPRALQVTFHTRF